MPNFLAMIVINLNRVFSENLANQTFDKWQFFCFSLPYKIEKKPDVSHILTMHLMSTQSI